MSRLGPIVAAAFLLLTGCRTTEPIAVAEVDGSNDHRIFQVSGIMTLLLEPAFWQLEDSHVLNLDAPLAACLTEKPPDEYAPMTLRALRSVATEESARLLVKAVCHELKMTPDAFCARYLSEPYGLQDTSLSVRPGTVNRLLAADEDGGMLSSASDILKLGYVLLPHLDRVPKGLLSRTSLVGGDRVHYFQGASRNGFAFVGFDETSSHVAVVLRASSDGDSTEGVDLLSSCLRP